jgi:protease-4
MTETSHNPKPQTPKDAASQASAKTSPFPEGQPVLVYRKRSTGLILVILFLLLGSVLFNVWIYGKYQKQFSPENKAVEKFYSGSALAPEKIAIIRIQGTIMPPFTERTLAQLEQAQKDPAVKGVLLTIDSPGGLVADSHKIYHQLLKLREEGKPVYVAMKRIAASGGYYVAMGAGPEGQIFAEPTTWTGSIGVIIPHYDVSGLAKSWNIKSTPLKTGKFKDALSPFREPSPEERAVWGEILNESFEKFLTVIDENRPQLAIRRTEEPTAPENPEVIENHLSLVPADAKADDPVNLSTGRIFTASQALKYGMVDTIGYEGDALAALKEKLGIEEARVITYQSPVTLLEMMLGLGKAQSAEEKVQARLDAAVPQAMYYFSWVPPALPMP